jgi:hypothetical protein
LCFPKRPHAANTSAARRELDPFLDYHPQRTRDARSCLVDIREPLIDAGDSFVVSTWGLGGDVVSAYAVTARTNTQVESLAGWAVASVSNRTVMGAEVSDRA